MRVLLTGAGGFIGSHVARHLLAQGDEVIAVLSPEESTARVAEIEPALIPIRADLESADLDRLVEQAAPDACIHLAWYLDPSRYLTAVDENLASLSAGTKLLSALDGAGCARAVTAGTCLEPGTLMDGEAAPAKTIYAAAKHALHQVGMHLPNTNVACAHIFYLYGPGEDRKRVVPTVIRACLEGRPIEVSSGEQRRDFLHVEDVASALVSIMKSAMTGQVDVCSGSTTPLREVFHVIGSFTGRSESIEIGKRPFLAEEPLEIAGDNAALVGTGWQPRWSLETGLEETVEWWRVRLSSEES